MDYFGVGNENWGCGGNMTPSYYGNLYRRYQTYVRNYDQKHPIFKVCCGPNAGDTYWTENVLKTCLKMHRNGCMALWTDCPCITIHCRRMTGLTREVHWILMMQRWYKTLAKAFKLDELIQKHSTIMDKYDPEKRSV